MRRDSSLSWVVDRALAQRRFRHLTPEAIRSYLLGYACMLRGQYGGDEVVNHAWHPHLVHSWLCGGWAEGLRFDTSNALAAIHNRLGVSCRYCPIVIRTQKVDWRYDQFNQWQRRDNQHRSPRKIICESCLKIIQRDTGIWQRKTGDPTLPEEWLIIRMAERTMRARPLRHPPRMQ